MLNVYLCNINFLGIRRGSKKTCFLHCIHHSLFFKRISHANQKNERKKAIKSKQRKYVIYKIIFETSLKGKILQRKMSRVMRKPTICICENKDADQLRGNREADQRLCFRYLNSTIPLLLKSKISSL